MTTPPIAGSENVWVWLLFLNFYSFPNFIAEKFNIHNMASFARSLQRICISSLRPQLKVKILELSESFINSFLFQFHNFSTSPPVLAAQVQKPAPAFKAQAVVGGQIKEVSLEDYKVTRILSSDLYLYFVHALFSG